MTDTTHATTLVTVEPREIATQRVHPLVHAAMQNGSLDPTTLRDLLAVQREWEAGEARKAYTRALAALKRDLPTVIRRDKVVDFATAKGRTYYTHTSLAQVMDEITAPLTAHGFSLSWEPSIGDRKVRVTCRLTHAEGHSEACTLESDPDSSGSKGPAQAIASTVTLLQRYTALSLLGIATADMQEPHGERAEESEAIDMDRNMAAVRAITKAGLRREDAESHVGRLVSEWTTADRRTLRAWLDAHAGDRATE